eukprot:scaffold5163_cov38-Prasinocladus_malaysianus.AAC.2
MSMLPGTVDGRLPAGPTQFTSPPGPNLVGTVIGRPSQPWKPPIPARLDGSPEVSGGSGAS